MNIIEKKKLNDATDMILHAPTFIDKPVLEMAVVLDHHMEKEVISELVRESLITLKKHNIIYQNVRLNVVHWKKLSIENEVKPMLMMTLSSAFEEYESETEEDKDFLILEDYLNMYQARSKVILLFSNEKFLISDEALKKSKLQPFLGKKLLMISKKEEAVEITRIR